MSPEGDVLSPNMGKSPRESEQENAARIFLPWISNKEKKFSGFPDLLIFSLRNYSKH